MASAESVAVDLPKINPEAIANATAPANLGRKATRGFAWMVAQTLTSKVASIAQQLLLAQILDKYDFGLIALIGSATAFAAVTQQTGMREILIRRHAFFHRWVNAAFWLSLLAGLIGMTGLFVAAPIVAHIYKSPALEGLVFVTALGLPVDALGVTSLARLQNEMRFQSLAIVGTTNALVMAVVSIAGAWLGFGAYSIVFGKLAASCVQTAMFLRLAPVPVQLRVQVHRWPSLLADARYLLATAGLGSLLMQGDYLITGLFFPLETLGFYYMAFNLSTQTVQLVGSNFIGVLTPGFSKLQGEPVRQANAYRNAVRLILFVGSPLCLIQAVAGGSFLHWYFHGRWDAAIPLFQILSVGMAFVLASSVGNGLLQAQGRFRTMMIWTAVVTSSYLIMVTAGAATGKVFNVAAMDVLFYVVMGPMGIYVAGRFVGFKARELLSMLQFPLGAMVVAGLAVWGGWRWWGAEIDSYWYFMCVAPLGVLLVYGGGAVILARAELKEITLRITQFASGR